MQDHAVFCSKCGSKWEEPPQNLESPQAGNKEKKKTAGEKSRAKLAIVCGAALLAAAAGISGGIFLAKKMAGGESLQVQGAGEELKLAAYDLEQLEVVENYQRPEDADLIDLYQDTHQPSPRDLNGIWDSSLFYWLEDGDADSQEDNHIADCILERLCLIRKDNGHSVDYEVYRDGENEAIYKIVSVEYLEDGTQELTDYYYKDGKPNFVFRRNDTVYTPSYASIDKVGERYYFNQDQMVKWRWIYEPQSVKQWVLVPEDTWYTQWAYADITPDEQKEYDAKEREMLNASYNTYHTISNYSRVSLLEGYVLDENGGPLEGVAVGVGDLETGEPFVKLETGADGRYAWEITDSARDYFLIFQKEGCNAAVMEPVLSSGRQMEQEQVVLYEAGEEAYPVAIDVFQMAEMDGDLETEEESGGSAEAAAKSLKGAEVEIRWGINCVSGEPLTTVTTDEAGRVSLKLQAGTYTAVAKKAGFAPMTVVFTAKNQIRPVEIYCLEEPAGDDPVWRVALTWDSGSGADLDSTMFTPEKGDSGNRVYINAVNPWDSYGNRFLYDGKGENSCEVIELTLPQKGSYKYYVNDYEGAMEEGGQKSTALSGAQACVSVFRDGRLVRSFRVPSDTQGVIWEVFEIQNNEVVPIQNVYGSAEGKGWWIQDKVMARLSDQSTQASWIQKDGEWIYFTNRLDEDRLYRCRRDGSGLTKIGDERVILGRMVLAEDVLYYMIYEDGYNSLCSIQSDGSNRQVLKSGIELAEGEGESAENFVAGYCNGRVYCCIAEPRTDFFGISTYDIASGQMWEAEKTVDFDRERYLVGNIQVIDGYLYYIYSAASYSTENTLICRQKAGGSEPAEILASCDIKGIREFAIQKGWLYYRNNEGSYCMMLDGSQHMPWDSTGILGTAGVIGGERYNRDCTVYDLNGNYLRDMFDHGPLIREKAVSAYMEFLGANEPANSGWKTNMETANYMIDAKPNTIFQFAAADFNHDGRMELITRTGGGKEEAGGSARAYTYDGTMQLIGHTMGGWYGPGNVGYNQERQALVFYNEPSASGQTLVIVSALDFTEIDRAFDAAARNGFPTEEDYRQSEHYQQVVEMYYSNYVVLRFVDNTEENRQTYIMGGIETGFESAW